MSYAGHHDRFNVEEIHTLRPGTKVQVICHGDQGGEYRPMTLTIAPPTAFALQEGQPDDFTVLKSTRGNCWYMRGDRIWTSAMNRRAAVSEFVIVD